MSCFTSLPEGTGANIGINLNLLRKTGKEIGEGGKYFGRGGVCPPFFTDCYIIVAKGGQTPPLQMPS